MIGLFDCGSVVGEEARDSYVGVADADEEEMGAVGGLDVVAPEVESNVAGGGGTDSFGVGVDVGGGVLIGILAFQNEHGGRRREP